MSTSTPVRTPPPATIKKMGNTTHAIHHDSCSALIWSKMGVRTA